MAERLTDFNKTGWVLKLDEPQNEFEARQQLMSKFKLACEKLGKIEDIMDKYGIESVEELEKEMHSLMLIISILNDYGIEDYNELDEILKEFSYMKKMETEIGKELKFYKTDRDTWKRACELACEREDDCYVYDNIHRAYEFYQQAKAEGNDEN